MSSDVVWLSTPPVVGAPLYPVMLDLVEAVMAKAPDGPIRETCRALAPGWEQLEDMGLAERNTPSRGDIFNADSSWGSEHFLIGTVAHAIALLGPGFGVLLRQPQRYDSGSAVFVRRLIREAERTGLRIAIEAPPSFASNPRYADVAGGVRIIPSPRRSPQRAPSRSLATDMVALCPQGVPIDILRSLGAALSPDVPTAPGPDGQPWAYLPFSTRRQIVAAISPSARRALHARLFEAWPSQGWGYLRRAGHASVSGDPDLMLGQHGCYVCGMMSLSADFLYCYYTALARAVGRSESHRHLAFPVYFCAGKLAPRVRVGGGFRAAISYGVRALKQCTDPADRTMLHYEIANNHAVQRRPVALEAARRWYRKGYKELEQITEPEARAREHIRLNNGLALVEYHQGRHREALHLEERAAALAVQVEDKHPAVAAWAKPLLNFNTAKLMARRFADLPRALELLQANRAASEADVRENASLDLARYCFDAGDFAKVAEVLAPMYEDAYPVAADEEEELIGRFMLSISWLALDERLRVRSQVPRLAYLANTIGSPGSRALVDLLDRRTP